MYGKGMRDDVGREDREGHDRPGGRPFFVSAPGGGTLGRLPRIWLLAGAAYLFIAIGIVIGITEYERQADRSLDLAIQRTGAELALYLSRETPNDAALLSATDRENLAGIWQEATSSLQGVDRLFVRVSDVSDGPIWEYGVGTAVLDPTGRHARVVTFSVPGRALSVQVGYLAPSRLTGVPTIFLLIGLIVLIPLIAGLLLLRPALRLRGARASAAGQEGSAADMGADPLRAGGLRAQPPQATPLGEALARAGCGITLWDEGARDIRVSGALLPLLGEHPHADILEALTPRDTITQHLDAPVPLLFDHIENEARAGIFSLEQACRFVDRDGDQVAITVTSLALPGSPTRFAAIWRVALDDQDQTDLAPQTLEHTEQTAQMRFAALIEGLPDGVALWEDTGALIAANERVLTILDVSRQDLQGWRHEGLMDETGDVFEADARWYRRMDLPLGDHGRLTIFRDVTVEAKQVQEMATLETKATQYERSASVLKDQLNSMRSDIERAGVTIESLEARIARETARAEAATHAMGEFLANASHELRTPLNAILGFSEMMAQEMFGPLGSEKYKEYATDIHASGQNMLYLVTDILDMARLDGPAPADVDATRMNVGKVVEACLGLVRGRIDAKSLELDVDLDRLPSAYADPQAIKRVLLHLLMNAIKFTPEGGAIRLRGRADLHKVTIAVEDTGMGIDPEDLDQLGQPFVRSRRAEQNGVPGLGLGLALSRHLAESNNGSLTLSSEPDQGTVALLTLPRRAARAPIDTSVQPTPEAEIRAVS